VADDERLVRGGPVLNDVLKSYDQYRPAIAAAGKKVTIVRFEARPNSPDEWWARMEASRISAEQKVKNFSRLGFTVDPVVDHVVLPDSVSRAEFLEVVRRANEDPAVSGIIVQFPPPEQVKDYIGEIAPEKDFDALLDQDSPYPACATAEGIWRVVERFAQDHPQIAVVGSKGFVGRGVVRMLEANGHQPIQLDINDDHNRVKEADIVISVTGKPGILGPEHLKPEHRLVVDSGFVPQRDGSPCGDVQPEATSIPQHITPVPGGTGPIEMAILMERAVRKEAAPNLPSWQYAGPSSRSQESATGLAVRAYGEPAREAIRGPAPGRTAGPVKPTTQEPAPRPRPAQKPNEDVR
jgi:methylenetetrahydrofolate dehydrogenase (NADP+)/methenyltetrahydrofolate cyclohydrolase